jgi:hypothetical protein
MRPPLAWSRVGGAVTRDTMRSDHLTALCKTRPPTPTRIPTISQTLKDTHKTGKPKGKGDPYSQAERKTTRQKRGVNAPPDEEERKKPPTRRKTKAGKKSAMVSRRGTRCTHVAWGAPLSGRRVCVCARTCAKAHAERSAACGGGVCVPCSPTL